MTDLAIRPALPEDLPALARLWHAGWHEAHAAIVPPALTRLRTEASFLDRLGRLSDALRVAGPDGEARLAASGVGRAVLLCAEGNDRAVRFYERAGWENQGRSRESVDTQDGPFSFDVLRFEKDPRPSGQAS